MIANKRFPLDLIAAVINGIAIAGRSRGRCVTLYAAPRPQPRGQARTCGCIAIVGGVLAAISGVVYAVVVAIKVHEFVTTGAQTYQEANHLTNATGLLGLRSCSARGGAAAGGRLRARLAERHAPGAADAVHGLPGDLRRASWCCFSSPRSRSSRASGCWRSAYLISGRWPTGLPPAWRRAAPSHGHPRSQMRAERAAPPAPGPGRQRRRGAHAGERRAATRLSGPPRRLPARERAPAPPSASASAALAALPARRAVAVRRGAGDRSAASDHRPAIRRLRRPARR